MKELKTGCEYYLDNTKEQIGVFVKYEVNGTPLFLGISQYYMSNDENLMPIRSSNGFEEVVVKYKSAVKAGRCFNGAHRDGGTIVHAIPNISVNGSNFNKAFCGTRPGIRGYGWNDTIEKPVNCEKCIKKLT